MIESLECRLTEVAELCRKYRVKKFEVFGSAVDGDWKPATSDFDFLVDFLPMTPAEHSKSYFHSRQIICRLRCRLTFAIGRRTTIHHDWRGSNPGGKDGELRTPIVDRVSPNRRVSKH